MSTRYDPPRTGLLLVDPYNDFLSEGGEAWPDARDVAQSAGLHRDLPEVGAVRAADMQVFILPHYRWRPGDHENWRHPSPSQVRAAQRQMFAAIEEHS
jgi:hypothetical protein